MFPVAFKITTRTANRLMFGQDLARNPEFLQLAIEYSDTFFVGANTIRHYPEWFKPVAMYLETGMYPQMRVARKHLYPLLRKRIQAMQHTKATGKGTKFQDDRPADVGERFSEIDEREWAVLMVTVQWVLDITPLEKLQLESLVIRLLHILVAAVHTSSVTWLNALYDLALHPEIHQVLRDEIADVFAKEDGQWSKQGLTKLVRLDSFIKESARFHPFQAGMALAHCTLMSGYMLTPALGTMDRIAMRDYTLSDGTFVPQGTYMITPSSAANFDPDVWGADAEKFDPWRSYKMRQVPGQETQHSMVQTSPMFTYFG